MSVPQARPPWPEDPALPGPPVRLTVALIRSGSYEGISFKCLTEGSGISGNLKTVSQWLPPWLGEHVHEEST